MKRFIILTICSIFALSCLEVQAGELRHLSIFQDLVQMNTMLQDVPEEVVQTVDWQLDQADLYVPEANDLTTVSVSPSGNFIAAVDQMAIHKDSIHAADVANPFGRLPEAIYLFQKQDEHYHLAQTIPVDVEAQLELSSMLGGGSAFAWNGEETQIVITGDWGANSNTKNYFMNFHSNLYLLDIASGEIQPLTENSEKSEHCALVQWTDDHTVHYLRMDLKDSMCSNALWEMDLNTGAETKLADLYNADGRVCYINDWKSSGQQIYYVLDEVVAGNTGFYVTPLGGKEADARCLINVPGDLVETNVHPYCRSIGFSQLEISKDGKWACLNVFDQRVLNRDIPLADDPQNPQEDPGNAISLRTGQPWVPCHNVMLYDLEQEQLVNPFLDEALAPTRAIVTGACLSPDGTAMLCAVFGDGGPWTMEDFTRTTFYLIDLADGQFSATRILETELQSSLLFPEGIRWMDNNVLCIPTGQMPTNPVQMLLPAALSR